MYSGNLGLTHDLGTILTAARRMRACAGVHFMIVGAGPQWKDLAESIAVHGDANITLQPLQPEDVLPYSLSCAEIALVSLEKGMEGISMPSKTYYSMAAGSAIIGLCPERSDLAYVLNAHSCGLRVEPGDVDGLVSAIESLRSSPLNCGGSATTPVRPRYALSPGK